MERQETHLAEHPIPLIIIITSPVLCTLRRVWVCDQFRALRDPMPHAKGDCETLLSPK